MSRLGELRFNQTTPLQFLHGLDIDVSLRCEMLTVVMSFALSPPLSFVDFRVRFSSAPTEKDTEKTSGAICKTSLPYRSTTTESCVLR